MTPDEIAQAHTIDDLLRERATRKRAKDNAVSLLTDAQHALEHGRLEVVAEFLDRALTYLA